MFGIFNQNDNFLKIQFPSFLTFKTLKLTKENTKVYYIWEKLITDLLT